MDIEEIFQSILVLFVNVIDEGAIGKNSHPIVVNDFSLKVVLNLFIGFHTVFGTSNFLWFDGSSPDYFGSLV